MPRLATFSAHPLRPIITPARGLHDPGTQRTYLFDELCTRQVSIGRGTHCDVRLRERRVSNAHALVTLHPDGRSMLQNIGRNGTYVDGEKVEKVVALTAGMHVHLGSEAMLVATDSRGMFPILAYTIPEICYYAVALHGNPTAASRAIGKSRKFIIKHANKFEKGSATWWRNLSRWRRRSNRIMFIAGGMEP